MLLFLFTVKGLLVISPNSSKVFLLFGEYVGSIKQNGMFWVNPFYSRITLSLCARNFESEKIKVNDKMGNPFLISVILVWRVKDTFKSTFEVDNYENFIRIQTDSAVRKLAGSFPYDHFEDEKATITLSTNFDDVTKLWKVPWGMVESALKLLADKEIIEFDEDRKAAMVSNLMVVLCGDSETKPVINTGTLNQ